MRVIKNYRFQIGTKIPFADWPALIHRFMEENSLTGGAFLYHFESDVPYNKTPDEMTDKCGCAKLLKDLPELGPLCFNGNYFLVSNLDGGGIHSDEPLLPLMKKIHRYYGFTDTSLYYYDVNFFGQTIPYCRSSNSPAWASPLLGSGLRLHRDVLAQNYIELSVDILYDGKILDPESYFRSLRALLPKISVQTSLEIHLTDEEQAQITETHEKCAPALAECRNFFAERLLHSLTQNNFPSNYSLAVPLKKLAKQFGFTVRVISKGCTYALEKQTPNGNFLCIGIDAGPSRYDAGVWITFQGLGFKHYLGTGDQTPTNQAELDRFLEQVLCIVSAFETAHLSDLDAYYTHTPDWFQPDE